MANFETALDKVLKAEGGYQLTDIKDDAGGKTYAGITKRSFPDWVGWSDIDNGLKPTASVVADLYFEKFWNPTVARLGIQNDQLADTLFSAAVNMGVGTVLKILHISLGLGSTSVVTENTISKLTTIDPQLIDAHFKLACIARYSQIVAKNPTQIKFLRGWINRILEA